MYSYDTTTFELGETRLRLKSGLRFSIQTSRHGEWYLIEDNARSAFYRIGPAEYTFLSMLDGDTTLATAMARTCSLRGSSALDEQEAIQLCHWLVESGLAYTTASVSAGRMEQQRESRARQQTIQRLNPVSVRIPLGNPDRWVGGLARRFGWMISWPFALVWVFVCSYALLTMAMDWDRLCRGTAQVFSRDGWLWMAATWLILKLVHETAHGITCRKFGGRTGNSGILFLLLIPLPYIDVTSAWRFTDKYQRILVSAAGMLAEWLIAAIAAIVWVHSGPGLVAFHASNIIIVASLHTLLFNANPLLRFDGYHILADWLEIPNLGNHGQRYVRGVFRKWLFGFPPEELKYAGMHGWVIRVYGFAALAWRIMLCLVLILAAANLFQGIGLLVALVASVFWLAIPVCKFVRYVIHGTEFEQPDRRRFSGVVLGGLTVAILGGLLIPAPARVSAPLVVEYDGLKVIRSETSGFVRSIAVTRDQQVAAGDLLMTLENPELQTQLTGTRLKLQAARIRANARQSHADISALQMELESVTALEKQLQELEDSKASLQIHAPTAGTVISRGLHQLLGSYVHPGTELVRIGDDSRKAAIVLMSQHDATHLSRIPGVPVDVRIWGQGRLESARIHSVNPSHSDDLPHFAFAGIYGGPLEVARRSQLEETTDTSPEDLMLIDSRVQMHLAFDEETSQRLRSGQTGMVHVRARSESMGGFLANRFHRWLGRQIKLNHGL